jgi:phytoene dehydrogenase-like protein
VVTYDTLIIGAGMSGLAAGIRLAQFGQQVCILERHEVWGGLNSFYTLAGRPFDVGLHALTNYVPKGTKGAPLTRILRQLRLKHDDLKLAQQGHSEILLPGLRLTFTNEFGHFQAEVEREFPSQKDGFASLVAAVRETGLIDGDGPFLSAREVLSRHVSDPRLIDALLLPTLYYGSAREDDIDWRQFVIIFQSVLLEGLAQPEGGIRTLTNLLIKRVKAAGAELRLRSGVKRILIAKSGRAHGVELDDGEILEAAEVFSSAGFVETMRLCGQAAEQEHVRDGDVGRLSFLETISVLDRLPAELGHTAATSFFSTRDSFRYRRPDELLDTTSGVVSAPANFKRATPPKEGLLRLTVIANHDRWCALDPETYVREKEQQADAAIASAATLFPDWRPHTVFRDVFTPRTIRRFTGHLAGAVYGSPRKHWSGRTDIEGLTLIGTDQGYLGVIGALLSGTTMANHSVHAHA